MYYMKKLSTAAMIAMAVCSLASAQKVEMYTTTDKAPWKQVKNIKWSEKAPEGNIPVVTVTENTAQTIDGIGGHSMK